VKPSITTLDDIERLFLYCFVGVTLAHLLRPLFGFDRESQKIIERIKVIVPSSVPDLGTVKRAARHFHLTLPAFFATYLPMMALTIGNSGCSLLRDIGVQIFPWPLFTVCFVNALTAWFALDWRKRAILEAALELHSRTQSATSDTSSTTA